MNKPAERLRNLKADLEDIANEYEDVLDNEHTIAHPLHQTVDEAKRRWKIVGGDQAQ